MTIDERLEKLAERHEALTQTVELIAAMQRDNDARFEQMHQRNEALFTRNEERFARNEQRLGQVMDVVNSLARIAEAHEHRIDRLEQP